MPDCAPEFTKVNESGRIVIPAVFRQELGIEPGDRVIMNVVDGVLHVESHRARLHKNQQILKQFIPEGRILSDELIAERREEAAREQAEMEAHFEELGRARV